MMAQTLARNWWVMVLRGVASILFGVSAFFWPGLTGLALVWVFGAYALVDGVMALVTGLARVGKSGRWWGFLLEGLLGIAAGLAAFFWPGVTALTLVILIAVWAILTGIFEIITAIRLRQEIEHEWLLGLSGVASVLFGGLLIFQPAAGGIAVLWIIGAYALVFGFLLIVLGFRLRGWRPLDERKTEPLGPAPEHALRS